MNETKDYRTLDRIEGDRAVLTAAAGGAADETRVPCTELEAGCRKGALLYWDAAAGLWREDAEAGAAQQAQMKARVAALLARHKPPQ